MTRCVIVSRRVAYRLNDPLVERTNVRASAEILDNMSSSGVHVARVALVMLKEISFSNRVPVAPVLPLAERAGRRHLTAVARTRLGAHLAGVVAASVLGQTARAPRLRL